MQTSAPATAVLTDAIFGHIHHAHAALVVQMSEFSHRLSPLYDNLALITAPKAG